VPLAGKSGAARKTGIWDFPIPFQRKRNLKAVMKKTISISLILLLLCGLASGCRARGGKDAEDEKISVVTTIFPQYDFVRQIAGEHVDLKMLLSPGMEPHSYEPTPQDIKDISSCDIFIYVGGHGEKWAENILSSMDADDMTVIALIDCVEPVEEELREGMQDKDSHHHDEAFHDEDLHGSTTHVEDLHHAGHGHDHKEYDEHVWTSPENAKLIVRAISDVLIETDPSNASLYRENTQAYIQKLDELDRELKGIVDKSKRKTIVVGDRFPFRYLTDAYGLEYYAAFPGCAPEAEPSAATIAFLIDIIKVQEIPVVFCMELSNEKIADILCESTGAEKLTLHSCHNLTKSDFEEGLTYLELMYQNAQALKKALA
jgi:zinc transport system substrate-binding protein